jgi:hypothetical protein
MVEFLPDSRAVHAKLRQLFSRSTRGRRRVVCVAYVGVDAPSLLPDYAGVELYCWPQAGATDPRALAILASPAFGAKVFLADRLHAKLFWVADLGYVITSANLSSNALSELGLREVGVFVPNSAQVNINRLISSLKARRLRKTDLGVLERGHDRFWGFRTPTDAPRSRLRTFREWYGGFQQPEWKLAWWDTVDDEEASTAAAARSVWGVSEIDDFMDFNDHQIERGDWILCYHIQKKDRVGSVDWLYVHDTHKLTADERHQRGYSHQAIQLWKPRAPMRPPFSESADAFLAAFRRAVKLYGLRGLKLHDNSRPSPRFLEALAAEAA